MNISNLLNNNMVSSSSIRPGMVIEIDNCQLLVLKYIHIKKGRGQAINRVKVKDIVTGSITEKTFTNEQSIEIADTEKKTAQFLYADKEDAFFMSTDDFSQFSLPLSDLENDILFLKDGEKVIVLYIDGSPVSIEVPKTVVLKVDYTEPASAGNTATGALKVAGLETGLKAMVPLFIKIDDYVRINTTSNEYVERVKNIN